MSPRLRALALPILAALLGCGGGGSSGGARPDAGPTRETDGGIEGGSLAGGDASSGHDASGDAKPDAAQEGDAAAGPDATPDGPGPEGGVTLLSAGATSGTLNGADLGVDLSGTGTAPVGAIAITGGHGTVTLDGEGAVESFVMERQPFGTEDLYQIVAVSPDRLTFLWVYCEAGTTLDAEYWEDTRGQASGNSESSGADGATGTCVEHLTSTAVPVSAPAFAFPPPPSIADVTVTATGLTYSGTSPGSLADQGTTYALYPFHHVDCSACGSTPAEGWQELHSILWNEAASTVSFGIIYLFPAAAKENPELAYAVTLPTLAEPADETFAGTWTGPTGMMKRPPRLRGPLPRRLDRAAP